MVSLCIGSSPDKPETEEEQRKAAENEYQPPVETEEEKEMNVLQTQAEVGAWLQTRGEGDDEMVDHLASTSDDPPTYAEAQEVLNLKVLKRIGDGNAASGGTDAQFAFEQATHYGSLDLNRANKRQKLYKSILVEFVYI